MKPNYSPPLKAFGYSLLEVSVAMLLFGQILLISGTSLLGLMAQSKRFQVQAQANRLAHNLMETLLALPPEKAKALPVETDLNWTDHHRFTVKTLWQPYASNPRFDTVTVEYVKGSQTLIRLSGLMPHSTS